MERSPTEKEIIKYLKQQWRVLLPATVSNITHIDQAVDQLVRQYQLGDRPYHNLWHIYKVDQVIERFRLLAHNYPALKLAAHGHDVIYNPGSTTNELDSVNFMANLLNALMVSQTQISEVQRLILLTENHQTTEDDTDGLLLIDADFAIFASSADEYQAYTRGIWDEYVTSGKVTSDQFRVGRSKLIEDWLSQPIFHTPQIHSAFEQIARTNLIHELTELNKLS